MDITTLCVFCGAQNAVPAEHLDIGTELGKRMAAVGKKLVYGGGDCGIMGRIANAVMQHGGWVTGVFPRSLRNIENEHKSLTEIIIVDGMHERKQLMYERSDAFVVLPGGFGTLDELFEILTWKQLRLHSKPIVIFNHNGYWNHLVALMENIINTGFARMENKDYYVVFDTFDELAEYLGL